MTIKERVGKVAPEWVVRAYRTFASSIEFFRDFTQYAASSSWYSRRNDVRGWRDSNESYQSRLTISYHGLEKGATFPVPKRPYGASKCVEIQKLVNNAASEGLELTSREHALRALTAVEGFNRTGVISDDVSPLRSAKNVAIDKSAFRAFVKARHSIRNFDASRPVDEATVLEALTTAAEGTPSVCNRRSYRAHYYSSRKAIDSLLDLQNGNRGFGHTVQGLFIVTERRSAFVGAGERNQRWVDGGLFAMTLMFSLHAVGLGTCFLNWSQTHAKTSALRARGDIPKSEDIVVLIAVGYPPKEFRVASSPVRPLSETFVRH